MAPRKKKLSSEPKFERYSPQQIYSMDGRTFLKARSSTTREMIVEALSFAPKEVIDAIISEVIFMVPELVHGEVSDKEETRGRRVVMFPPHLFKTTDKECRIFVILHETAHVYCGHEGIGISEDKYKLQESAADELATKWFGYMPEGLMEDIVPEQKVNFKEVDLRRKYSEHDKVVPGDLIYGMYYEDTISKWSWLTVKRLDDKRQVFVCELSRTEPTEKRKSRNEQWKTLFKDAPEPFDIDIEVVLIDYNDVKWFMNTEQRVYDD